MEVPIEWVIAVISALGGTIAYLARMIHANLSRRIDTLVEVNKEHRRDLTAQGKASAVMMAEIKRLEGGCGTSGCLWRAK